MTDFNSWTTEQQRTLWLQLAREALSHWQLQPQAISWLGYQSNAVFKVSTSAASYVLRLNPPGLIERVKLRSELLWLRAIRQQTDLLAPYPLTTVAKDSQAVFVELRHDALPPPQLVYGSLFELIEGDSKPAHQLDTQDLYQIGRYLGRLHREGQISPPADFQRPRLDWDGFFGASSPYASAGESQFLTAEQQEVFAGVAEQARVALDRLNQQDDSFGLIHADLLAKNIIFSDGAIAALDFEFCAWGYFLYDLAPLLWQLKGERAADYLQLEKTLWRAYTSVRDTAESQRDLLEPFIATRQLLSCRWLLRHRDHPDLRAIVPELVAERTVQLKEYLATGVLQRKTPTL